jgi:tetratricopeptide (TPR) repeat protein
MRLVVHARLLLAAWLLSAGAAHAQWLQVGDKAPALSIGEIVKGEPIGDFERGKVYVVDFWATWSQPSTLAFEDLTRIQCEFAPRGVEVVGVNVMDDPRNVRAFMSGKDAYLRGDRVMGYTVCIEEKSPGTDPRRTGAMTNEWLRASGQAAVPITFIIDRDRRIAWIGHPTWPAGELEDYLEHVVAGTLSESQVARLRDKWANIADMTNTVTSLSRSGEYESAIEAMDRLAEANPPSRRDRAVSRFEILLNGLGDEARAYAFAKEAGKTFLRDDATRLNYIAWMIVDEPKLEHRDYDVAITLAERACEISQWRDPAILDTLAKACFDSGQRRRGLRLQVMAAQYAAGTKWQPEIDERLKLYRNALKED